MEDILNRQAIRNLVDDHSRFADRREAAKQAGLYTMDASFTLFPRGENGPAAFTLTSRDQLMGSFEKLKPFKAVTHFNAQNYVDFETPERATGEVYCKAHLLTETDGKVTMMVQAIRYQDVYVKLEDGKWYIAQRKLIVDWAENRAIN